MKFGQIIIDCKKQISTRINNRKIQMMEEINFEQERLLNQQSNYQKIKNVRLRKELEFLTGSNLRYTVCQVMQDKDNIGLGSSIIMNENKPESEQQPVNLRTVYANGQRVQISNTITFPTLQHLSQPLTLLIPKNYPFQQPLYCYHTVLPQNIISPSDNINNNLQGLLAHARPISQLLIWIPKYKILELVELIAIKLNEKHQQETIIQQYIFGKIIQYINGPNLIFLLAILVRILVGLGSYSGKGDWPNLGDFEAHRNWMSITVNRPINQWYVEPQSDIWWRIDYPPIAAYLSYLLGSVYKFIQPQAMALQRGYQSTQLVTFMRVSVLLVEAIFLFPAIYLITQLSFTREKFTISNHYILLVLLVFLIKPDAVLIDHGHFQYNSLILGLILSAFYCLKTKSYYLCCLLFTLAIHSKQMSVYYALAFFGGLIGSVIRDYKGNNIKIISMLVKFGVIVISTTLLIWLPFILTNSAHNVISAIFPIHRGLYQLKVQNFWCISDVLFKWEKMFSNNYLMIICFILSTLLSLPSVIAMIFRPTKKILTIGFYTISMTFFMFSYHVHEKSILLPLLMGPLLIQYLGAQFVTYLILAGTIGMYHLLKQDGQSLQYFVLVIFYWAFMKSFSIITSKLKRFLYQTTEEVTIAEKLHQKLFPKTKDTFLGNLVRYILSLVPLILHLCQILISTPQKFEYLYHLLFAFYSFCFNFYSLLICNGVLLETIKNKLKCEKINTKSY